ncbi:MAG: hypothetical protein ACSNEK_03235 [Parachlamydiaceae bacterium]
MRFPIILATLCCTLASPCLTFALELSRVDERPNLYEINRARKWQKRSEQHGNGCCNTNPNAYDYDYPPD